MEQTQSFGRKDGRQVLMATASAPQGPESRRPSPIVWICFVVLGLGVVGGAFMLMRSAGSTTSAGLARQSELAQAVRGSAADSMALVQRYPRDPRLRLIHGQHLAENHDLGGAEQEYRRGLSEVPALGSNLSNATKVEAGLRMALVSDLLLQGKHDAAVASAQPLCSAHSDDPAVQRGVAALRSNGVCV